MAGRARLPLSIAAALLLCLTAGAGAQEPAKGDAAAAAEKPAAGPLVLVVDRDKMISESEAARSLKRIEIELRDKAQAQLDQVKTDLEKEEQELTRLRDSMPKDEFDKRAREFDKRVREERRKAQERGAQLQKFIGEAEDALRKAAEPVLQDLLKEKGAAVLLDAKSVAAVAPEYDITNEAIARLDEVVNTVTFTPPPALQEK